MLFRGSLRLDDVTPSVKGPAALELRVTVRSGSAWIASSRVNLRLGLALRWRGTDSRVGVSVPRAITVTVVWFHLTISALISDLVVPAVIAIGSALARDALSL